MKTESSSNLPNNTRTGLGSSWLRGWVLGAGASRNDGLVWVRAVPPRQQDSGGTIRSRSRMHEQLDKTRTSGDVVDRRARSPHFASGQALFLAPGQAVETRHCEVLSRRRAWRVAG